MIWAYVLENQGEQDLRNNQPVFQLINELPIEDDYIVFDNSIERENLSSLLDRLAEGDKLVFRSVEDFADTIKDLMEMLKRLTERKVTLCSCKEPFLCGDDYLGSLNCFLELYIYYAKKMKELGYQKAVEEGRVGRPQKVKEIGQAISLYNHGVKIEQIAALTGVSKSTIYRYINKEE